LTCEETASLNLLSYGESVMQPGVPGEDGCVWINLTGLGRFYRSEEAVASALVHHVRRVGMEAVVGIAANRELAHLAACCGGSTPARNATHRRDLRRLRCNRLYHWPSPDDLSAPATQVVRR
jgi:hypothetical protein